MRFNKILVSCGLMLAVFSFAPKANALSVAAVGSFNLSTPSISPAPPSTVTQGAATGIGFGALFDYSSFELGALYSPVGTSFTALGTTTTNTFNEIFIPLTYQIKIAIIRIGVGGYYGIPTGNVSSQVGSAAATTSSLSSNNVSSSDFGLTADVGIRLPLAPAFGILAEARYMFGLSNLSTASGSTVNTRDIMILAGIELGF